MKKKINGRRVLCLLLVMLLVFPFSACGKSSGSQEKDSSDVGAKGRYVEEPVSFDKGNIITFHELEGGKIRMLTDTGIYDSSDQGESWTVWENTPEELQADMESGSAYAAVISRKGSILYCMEEKYKLMMPDGSMKMVPLESFMTGEDKEELRVWYAAFTASGDLLCMGIENIYQLDGESLSIKHIYGQEVLDINVIADRSFCVAGDKFYVIQISVDIQMNGTPKSTDISIKAFDTGTYESLGHQVILEQFFQEVIGNWYGLEMVPEHNGKALYLIGQEGIFRWQTDGTAIEKIFNGELGQMMSESIVEGALFGENSLMLLYPDSTSRDPYESLRPFKYFFDPNASLQPEKKLTVYSMYENHDVRQAITAFRQKQRDVAVAYEVGLTGEDGVTMTDALKILNTNIMAGKGPDVLLLQGMPVDTYLEKGILTDLSDVVKDVDSTDGIFENIAGTYRKGETIGAVPTSFAVPLILGKNKLLEQAGNLEGLVSAAETLRAASPDAKNILGHITPVSLLKYLTAISSPAWVHEDGTLDKEKLAAFLEAVQRIAKAQGNTEELIGEMENAGEVLDLAPFMASLEYTVISMGYTDAQLSLGYLKSNIGMMDLISMIKKMGDSGYAKGVGQAENVFVPLDTVGVSAKSTETDTAKEFVRYLLTENQKKPRKGWPVNKAVFDQTMEKPEFVELCVINQVNDVDGSTYEIEQVWPTKEEFQELKALIETLDTPAVTDEIINRTVLEEGMKCIRGEVSASEAADTILSRVNLYLAE